MSSHMPCLDIATAQPSLQNHLLPPSSQILVPCKALPNPWKSSLPKRDNLYARYCNLRRGDLLITATTMLEHKRLVQEKHAKNDSQLVINLSYSRDKNETASEDSEQLDEREKARRMRISKANKGNTPWNKGRKHSAETLQRIRERTKLAMQNPKIKMKLASLGHAQSEETRLKIAHGVRMKWEMKHEEQMVQETCHFEWQNLIAEASRRGYAGEEELQWDSYKLLDEQLTQEWLESVEERKSMPKLKDSKRTPKSLQQRRRIAEAIAAKWADLEYRERVCSGLAKYHGASAGAERKPKRKPSGTKEVIRRSPVKRSTSDMNTSFGGLTKIQIQQPRLQRSKKPYKDPLASSKLTMIQNIRAERAAAESKKMEAVERARQLIAGAEKAAKALEDAAVKSPIAQASLIESRKLIAEAIQSIKSIESGKTTSNGNGRYPSVASPQILGPPEKYQALEDKGSEILLLSENGDLAFKLSMQDIVNGDGGSLSSSFSHQHSLSTCNSDGAVKQPILTKRLGQLEPSGNTALGKNLLPNGTKVHSLGLNWKTVYRTIEREKNHLPNGTKDHPLQPNGAKLQVMEERLPMKAVNVTKKWVRGRLVGVVEGA